MNSRVHLCLIIACRNLQPTSAHTNCLIDLLNSPEPPRDSGRRESPPQRGRVLYPPPHPWQLLSAPFYKHRQHSPKLFPRQHRQTATASARSAHYRERSRRVNRFRIRTRNFRRIAESCLTTKRIDADGSVQAQASAITTTRSILSCTKPAANNPNAQAK